MHIVQVFIYILPRKTWIQMSADGKLDLHAEDDISMHTQQISIYIVVVTSI